MYCIVKYMIIAIYWHQLYARKLVHFIKIEFQKICFVTIRSWSFSETTLVTSQDTVTYPVTSQHPQNEKYLLETFVVCFNIKGNVYNQDTYFNHAHPK